MKTECLQTNKTQHYLERKKLEKQVELEKDFGIIQSLICTLNRHTWGVFVKD